MSMRACLALCVVGFLSSTCMAAAKVAPLDEAPQGLAKPVADVIAATGYRITEKDKPVCDVWFAKELGVKPNFKASIDGNYPLTVGQLVGIVRFPEKAGSGDFKGQSIKPGLYTLRFGLQPSDGNHLGTSDTRDFLLACPIAKDADPKPIAMTNDLFKISSAAAGSTHPTIFQLPPPAAKPALGAVLESEKLIVTIPLTAKAGDTPTVLGLRMVVVGKSEG